MLEYQDVAKSIDPALSKKLEKTPESELSNKESLLNLANKILSFCDDVDDDISTALDYLQCQVDHDKNRKALIKALEHVGRTEYEAGELRYLFRDLREGLMRDIRYGKRTEELDHILTRLTTLITLAQQQPRVQPQINLAGVENLLSPRCNNCTEGCRAAHRKIQMFVTKIKRSCTTEDQAA